MGQWTMVIHGVGAHHNWATEERDGPFGVKQYISGRRNDHDADLMFAEFVDELKAKGHNVTGATITCGGMNGVDGIVRRDGKTANDLAGKPND